MKNVLVIALLVMALCWGFHLFGRKFKRSWQPYWKPLGYDETLAEKYNWWLIVSLFQLEIALKPYALRITVLGWRKLFFWSWLCKKFKTLESKP